jgi:hypothetical protein
MKRHLSMILAAILALSIAVGGCASRQHSSTSSTATHSTPSLAAQYKNSGWYLMQPPVRHGNLDTGAKLADWQVLAFFDRASQCDAAREQGLSAYASYLPVSGSAGMDSVQMSQRLASSTLCVAANDPRINWFHIQWK